MAALLAVAWPGDPVGAQPESSPLTAIVHESPARALARLDSLMAVVHAEEARVRGAPRVEAFWDRLARAWFQVGDHARAAQCLERARALGAREFDTMLLSGRVARSESRFGEAIAWLERAVRARPEDWEAREDLGLALYLDGRHAEAADHWERARALPGSGSPDRRGLIAALRRVGARPYEVSGRARERLRFVPQGPRGGLVVAVHLNGAGPYLVRIDAGSPEGVLGRSLARELGLEFLTGDEGASGGPGPRFDYAVLDSLSLGGTTLRRLPVAVSDHPGLDRPVGTRGTLGFEVLRRFRFCLDVRDSTLWLDPPPGPATTRMRGASAPADTLAPPWAPAGAVVHRLPVLLRGTHLLIAFGRLGAGPERPFLLDPGASGVTLAAPMSTFAEAGVVVDTTRALSGSSAAGPVRFHRFPVGRLCLGGACRDSLLGDYGTFPARLELNPSFRVAGLVGSAFLSRYRFGLDLARRELWLVEPP